MPNNKIITLSIINNEITKKSNIINYQHYRLKRIVVNHNLINR